MKEQKQIVELLQAKSENGFKIVTDLDTDFIASQCSENNFGCPCFIMLTQSKTSKSFCQ